MQQHETFSSRWAFLMATISSAVGLGNLWLFPYIAGQNGGGAFVFVYLAIIFLIGVPLVLAELMIGRRGGQSPVASVQVVCEQEGAHPGWQALGWLGIVAPPIALSFYATVTGWSMEYVWRAASGGFSGLTGTTASAAFDGLLASPMRLIFWQTVSVIGVVYVVGRGVRAGIEQVTKVMMPALFILLVIIAIYSNFTGAAAQGWRFLFAPDFSKLTPASYFIALGQAFFSITVGAGILMTYGAYLSKDVSLPRAAVTIGFADTAVALLAGLAIFPIVFASGLDPGEGPGLTFVTLPVAFGSMPAGQLFGTAFFVLLLFAAFSSCIGMLEPMVSYLEERKNLRRMPMAITTGIIAWVVGIGAALSFNVLKDFKPFDEIPILAGRTIFDMLVFVVTNLCLPISGFLIALFAGWVMSSSSILEELGVKDGAWYRIWLALVRYVSPLGVGAVFFFNFVET